LEPRLNRFVVRNGTCLRSVGVGVIESDKHRQTNQRSQPNITKPPHNRCEEAQE
jgi:hypothetical protein